MLLRIIQFELSYRMKRPATYIYFAVLFVFCFIAVSWDSVSIGGAVGQVKEDAAWVIANQTAIMSLIAIFISSAVMGVPILRDFEHRTASMMFTTPIQKGDYLFGRFLGSFIVLVLILTGIPLGLMMGRLVGEYMPWAEGDWSRFLPEFRPGAYWSAFVMFILPNAFISGALFFLGGALSKRLLFVFLQGIGLFTLYSISGSLIGRIESRELASLLDPFAFRSFSFETQYWSIAEKNYQLLSWSGHLLQNRLLWLAIGVACLALTYFLFSFTSPSRKSRKSKKKKGNEASLSNVLLPENLQLTYKGSKIQWQRMRALIRIYYREIVRSIPFLGIVLCGFIFVLIPAARLGEVFGTPTFPTTYLILELFVQFDLFFFIIVIFYSGELIWRERDLRINQIYDTLPMPDAVGLVSKFIAFMLVHMTLLLTLIVLGVLIQTGYGYYKYELGIYFSTMFSSRLSWLALFTLLTFFVQVMINNKFLGHGLMIVIFILIGITSDLGLEHNLFQFASGGLEQYSDMNIYGDSFNRFSWFKAYWFGFSLTLFGLAIAFSVRGTDTLLRTRAKLAGMRYARPLLIFSIATFLMFAITGGFIYYQTTQVNEFQTSKKQEKDQARYEKELKQYEFLNQPKIVENTLNVDIFPMQRDYEVDGYYILKNKSDEPIPTLHIQGSSDPDLTFEPYEFEMLDSLGRVTGGQPKQKVHFEDFGYTIFELPHPLQPGDSMKMSFKGKFDTKGFKNGGTNNSVIFNGTFFNNSVFPAIGYNAGFELAGDDDRKKQDLPEKERQMERDDPRGIAMQPFVSDADWIRFDITMSTREDQIAIAPGYLQEQWTENGRNYFHYKMDRPILKFFSMISARYEVMRDWWIHPSGDSVKLEIFYHKGHEYNLDRMMAGMRNSLEYFSKAFSPFQYRQMRIMEFPRYASFAQSFANTVPFSEGIGFIVNIDDEKDVDISYYVTSHEVAHQWWAHQVIPANTKGSTMIVESLAQYSALMLMKETNKPEKMFQFLKEELDRYLSGRSQETKKELPLVLVENQQYIHYGKGAIVFYALADYITEDSLNLALSRFVDKWAYSEGLYPTTKDLMEYIYDVTPDSLRTVVEDMFERITFYENKTLNAEYAETGEGSYEVELELNTVKNLSDSLGNESKLPMNEWLYVGVYGEDVKGKDSLLYYKKHFFNADTTTVNIQVDAKPTKAGVDPIHLLIDKHPRDNTKSVVKKEEN